MSQDPEASRAFGLAHGQVCYLQLPAADLDRAAAFYRAVFGWQTETHHPDFESPGLIGQWVEGRRPARDAGPVIWLAVADMNETLDQVTRHGGQILEPPAPDGPTRILATIADPEGNPIGLAAHAPGATADTHPPPVPALPLLHGCRNHVAITAWLGHSCSLIWYGRCNGDRSSFSRGLAARVPRHVCHSGRSGHNRVAVGRCLHAAGRPSGPRDSASGGTLAGRPSLNPLLQCNPVIIA